MAVSTADLEVMVQEIALGVTPAESVLMPMTADQVEAWEQLEVEMIETAARGWQVQVPSEHPALQNYREGQTTPIDKL